MCMCMYVCMYIYIYIYIWIVWIIHIWAVLVGRESLLVRPAEQRLIEDGVRSLVV